MSRLFSVVWIWLLAISSSALAAEQCTDVFPGPQTFSTTGSFESLEGGTTCNGGSCSPASFTRVSSLPNNNPDGKFNDTSLVAGEYKHSKWDLGENANITFSGSGTAVLYFKQDVVIPKGTKINKNGDPWEILLVFKGKLKIEENTQINAFIYVDGSETTIEKNTTLNGGVAARTKLSLKENSTFNFTPADLNNLDPQGFCEAGAAAPQISIADTTATAGDNASFTVSLAAAHTANITLNYATANGTASAGSDYTAKSGTLTIPQGDTSATINVSTSATGSGTFNLNLSNASVGEFADASAEALILSSCDAENYAIYAATEIEVKDDGGSHQDITLNGNVISPVGKVSDNAINLSGSIVNPSMSLPSLPSVSFNSSPDYEFSSWPSALVDGSYAGDVKVKENKTVTIPAGTYYFSKFEVKSGATVNLGGKVVINVRDFKLKSNSSMNSGGDAANLTVNVYPKSGGDEGKFKLESNSRLVGSVFSSYSNTKVELKKNTSFSGGIFTAGKVKLESGAAITYGSAEQSAAGNLVGCDDEAPTLSSATASCSSLTTVNVSFSEAVDNSTGSSTGNYSLVNTDTSSSIAISSAAVSNNTVTLTTATLATGNYQLTVNNVEDSNGNIINSNSQVSFSLDCSLPDARLEYRFDQCDLSTGVPDSANSYDGTANNAESTNEQYRINLSLDLSATDTSDYVTVPRGAVHGLDDFSISTWIKTNQSPSQQEIFQALGSNADDDEIEIYLVGSNQVRMNVGDNGNTVSAGKTLTDNNWHHLLITRSGQDMCLYVDGNLANCHDDGSSSSISIGNSSGVMIGQEQDSYGGSFDSSQSWKGYIDEFKIYGSKLEEFHADQIYTNEAAGRNADGSTRSPVTCEAPPLPDPRLEYRFDECSLEEGVTDSVGSYDGTANNTESTDEQYVINRSLDLSVTDTSDYVTVPMGSVNGLNDFSISTWIKTNTNPSQQEIFQALGSSDGDNEIEIYLIGSDEVQMNVGNQGNKVDAGKSLTDNSWHHLLITRSGNDMCLYVDGFLANCHDDGSGSQISINNGSSVIIGQEQDSFGGSFDSGQSWKGYIDEFKIYASALEADHASQIYSNEGAGKNADDTPRDSVNCVVTLPDPLAEYRMDETSWNGSDDEVVDSAGSYHGEANGSATPVEGKICNAADLSGDTTADYLTLDGSFFSNQVDFTISTWVKTLDKTNQPLVSGARPGSDNELIFWFDSSTSFAPHLYGVRGSNIGSSDFADGSWRHLVWLRDGSQNCLYLDKVLQGCTTSLNSTAITIASNGLIIGQEQDSVGGGYDASQSYLGELDELIFFGEALSESQIEKLFDNQNAGLNYDGTARTCAVAEATAVAEWRFDEALWDGSSGEVKDSVGSDTGRAISDANTRYPGQICHAGEFDGSGDYVSGLDLSQLQTTASLSFWIKTSQTGNDTAYSAPGVAGVEVSASTDDIFWGWLDASGRIGITVGDDHATTKSNTIISNNSWHHVVLTRNADNGDYQIFIDGSLDKSGTGGIGDIGNSFSSIGRIEDTAGSPEYFNGQLDEVIVFSGILEAANVASIYANQSAGLNWDGTERGDCASTVEYYQISHASPSLTCEAATITITAKDASDQDVAPANGTEITVSAELVSGSNIVNTLTPSTYTFTGAESSTTIQLSRIEAGILDIDVTDGFATDQDGQATDPDIEFTDVAFKFYADGVADAIGTQIAGKLNTLAPGNQAITIRAIETDPTTGQCAALKPAAGFAMDFGYECESPNTCSGANLLTVNGTEISGFTGGSSPVYDPDSVTVSFDATGTGSLVINYMDAGQIQLFAKADVPVSGGSGNVEVAGSSNAFVVRPFAFGFPSIMAGSTSNPAGDETGGNGFTSAGNDFDVAINAYLYHSDDDSNADGVPDAGADVTDNGVTPNFTGTASISIDAYTPASGVQGNLTGATSPLLDTYANRSGNNVTATLQYDEVGSVSVLAQLNDYLGDVDADIQSVSTKIGRFYPDYFAFSDDAVTASCSVYTYMQQPFPSIAYRLEARAANDQVTENYDLSLYSNTASFELLAEDSDNGVDLSGRVNTSSSLAGWSAGVVDRTSGSALADVIFTRSGGAAGLEDGPYTQLQLGLRVDSELDNRDFADADRDMNAATAGSCGSSCDAVLLGSAQELRYGRLSITSAHGPETEVIPVPFVTQYWNGTNFVTNTDDSCTVLSKANIIFNSVLLTTSMDVDFDTDADVETTGSFTTETATDVTASSGDFGLLFSAPGIGTDDTDNTGSFPVDIINIDAWLRYDWDQNGSADDAEARGALVTFGRARGNDRMIFWQERYR